jgi:hypothetical protein
VHASPCSILHHLGPRRPHRAGADGVVLGVVSLPGHLLERLTLGLRHEEGEDKAKQVGGSEDEERIAHADARGVPGVRLALVLVLRRVQEPKGPDDGAGLPRGGGDAVACGPQPRREDLGRHDEGGAVGAEVCEEEGEGVHDDEADVVAGRGPVVVGDGEAEHEDGHHEEAEQLDGEAADDVDERDGEPVARDGAAERDERLGAGDAEHLLQRAHGVGLGDPVDAGEDVLLEQVLAVEGDVEQEPRGGGADEVEPVAARELPGEEAEGVALGGDHLVQLLLLVDDLRLEHPGHVGRGLLGVLGHERGVARRLGHLHPPVVGEHRRRGAQDEDDAPHVVGLRHGGVEVVVPVRRGRVPRAEGGGDDERDNAAGEDAEALHGEDGRDEGAAGLLVGVLGHDGRRQRVVPADAEPEPEAEEAERGHDPRGRVAEREARRDGADDHEHERHPVHALAPELVPEPAEEELAGQRAAEGDAVDSRGDVGRQRARVVLAGVRVVDAPQQLGDEGDAEEVVGVREEAHAGDDDGREVVPLRLRRVQRAEHLQAVPAARHGGCCSRLAALQCNDKRGGPWWCWCAQMARPDTDIYAVCCSVRGSS